MRVLIAAVLTVCALAAAGAYLIGKIIINVNNNISLQAEPENLILAVSEELDLDIDSESEDSESDDLELNLNLDLDSGSENKNKIIKNEKATEPAVNKESKKPVKNNLNKKAKAKIKDVKKVNKINLDNFKVKALKADEDDMMPEDKSKDLKDLNAEFNKKRKAKTFDGGGGLIGDIYRGAKKIVDGADKAALDTSRKVIGDTMDLDIDKARVRPGGGGVKLHLDIAPKSKNKK